MVAIGYALCCQSHAPNDLVRCARLAEEAGFTFAFLADHLHPWSEEQENAPFLWSIIGGIAQATQRLRLSTAMTCPAKYAHPVMLAQAAATAAAMMPGRFTLGLGVAEHLGEHLLGPSWPFPAVQPEVLEETVQVIRLLWRGGVQNHWGRYYSIENLCVYTPSAEPPGILIAGNGLCIAEIAGRLGDGFIGSTPDTKLVQRFEEAGGKGKPRYGKMTICWTANAAEARRAAHRWWLSTALRTLSIELSLPAYFVKAIARVSEDDLARAMVCSTDASQHIAAIKEFAAAGYDHICVHQVGPDQEGFIRFYQQEVLPALQTRRPQDDQRRTRRRSFRKSS